MDKSKFLSKAMGIYFIIVSIALILNMKQMTYLMSGYITSPSLLFTTGIITVILGILLVLYHNIWQWNWTVIITVLSWLILVKGISIILFPHFMSFVTMLFVQNHYFEYGGLGLDFLLGIYLSYMGFKR